MRIVRHPSGLLAPPTGRIIAIGRDPDAEFFAKWFPRHVPHTHVPWATEQAEEWAAKGRRLHCP